MAAFGGISDAWAYWSAGSTAGSYGASGAATVNQGSVPTATPGAGRIVSVSWAPSTLSDGTAVAGYIVRRYDANTAALQTTLGACSGTISTTICTETGVPSGQWQYTVTAVIGTNWLGNESPKSATVTTTASQARVGIVVDPAPPAVVARLTPAPNGSGWNNTAPVSVALNAIDGSGSGINRIDYTTDGSDPTSSGTARSYSAPIALRTTASVRYYATDNAGNASAVQTQPVRIDTVQPTNAISASSISGGAFAAAGTVFYRGSASGAVSLTNTLSDTGGSGPASSGTTALRGTTGGWSHGTSLASTPVDGPYVSKTFAWASGTSNSPSENVVGTDVAGNTTTTTLTFVDDTTAPTGGSVHGIHLGGTGGRYTRGLSLQIALAKGTDTGSGLAASGSRLLRAAAPLRASGSVADGACGTFAAYVQVGASDPPSTASDTVPTDGYCYRYEYVVPDNVGNVAVYTSPNIKVQARTPPSLTPTPATITPLTGVGAQVVSGSTVVYNATSAGSFTVNASAADPSSGIGHMAFPVLAGFSGGGNATTPTLGTTFGTTYSWSRSGASPSPGPQSLSATDNAGLTATTAGAFSVVADSAGPGGGSVDATGLVGTGGRWSRSPTLNLSFKKGASPAGLAASGARLLRAYAVLNLDGSGTCGSYSAFQPILGGNDPASPVVDSVPGHDACYRYEYIVPDNLGMTTTYTSPDIKVDTTVPARPTFSFAGVGNTYRSGSASVLGSHP